MQQPQHIALNQPAVKACIAFAFGIYIASQSDIGLSVLFCACSILTTVILIFYFIPKFWRRFQSILSYFIFILILLSGIFWSEYHQQSVPSSITHFAERKESIRILAVVQEDPVVKADNIRAVIDCRYIITDSGSIPTSGLVLLNNYKNVFAPQDSLHAFNIGDIIEVHGKLRMPRDRRNPGEFDYQKYLLAQDIVAIVSAAGGSQITRLTSSSNASSFRFSISAIRTEIRNRIRTYFSTDHAAFISGLLLGDYSIIDNSIINAFTTAGVIHVLSVSGLHVGMILIIILGLLGRFSMTLRVMLVIPLLLFYMLLTGSAPPVVRAVITACVYLTGIVVQRRHSPMNGVSFAALVLLILQPLNLFLVSFQLSFAGVFSLVLFYPRIQSLWRTLPGKFINLTGVKSILDVFGLTLAAQIGTAPFIFFHFGRFSIAAFAANIIVIPLIFVVTATSISIILLSYIWVLPAFLLSVTCRIVLEFMIWFTKWISSLPLASIDISQPTLLECTIYVIAVLFLFSAKRRNILFRFLLVLFGITAFFSLKNALEILSGPGEILRVTMLDVGQGDAIDIELPSKKHVLIDAGARTNSFDTGEKIILPFYKRNGIHELEAIILTHPDNDHIGGTVSLLNSIKVKHIYMSRTSDSSPDMKRLDSSLATQNRQVEFVYCHDTLAIESVVRMYVLHPEKQRIGQNKSESSFSSNNQSLVIMMIYGNTKFLFTGDVEHEGEDQMLQLFGNDLQADVLKVAHHGSKTCSTSPFLISVRPRIALISSGKLNKFNHPSDIVLSRLYLLHTTIHRSDKEGAVILESDGSSVKKIIWK